MMTIDMICEPKLGTILVIVWGNSKVTIRKKEQPGTKDRVGAIERKTWDGQDKKQKSPCPLNLIPYTGVNRPLLA